MKQVIFAVEGVSAHDAKKPGEQRSPLQRSPDLTQGLLVIALGQQQGGQTAGDEAERDMAFDCLAGAHLIVSPPVPVKHQ